MQAFEGHWPVLIAVAVLAVLIAWWLFSRASKPAARRERRPDVLDEGAAPAQRNQALIDSAPAAADAYTAPPAAELMGGIGEVVSAAVHEEIVDASGDEAAPAPAPEAAPAAPAADDAAGDDLTRIKGLGPKLATLLKGLGITSYAQIAAWTDEDLARIDPQLGAFAGRPARDQWIAQAKFLAAGDTTGYEGKFGKL
ncbi:MAG: helix-hairpin-helix domain-containing protein [Novosphingobium sp.]